MKTHLIEKTGTDSNKYSIYKNPDEYLRNEIKNFEIDETKIKMGWPERTWTIVEWEDTEVKCENGRNVQYFKREEIEAALDDKILYEINQKYQASEYFKKHFGVVSFYREDEDHIELRKLDLKNSVSTGSVVGMDRKLNPLSVEFYGDQLTYRFSCGRENIYLETDNGMGSMQLYFNKNGDYVNRDYNLNLDYYKCEDISPKILLDKFEETILKIENLYHMKGKYYTDKFMYIPFVEEDDKCCCGVQAIPVREDEVSYKGVYERRVYKRPKKLDASSSESLLNDIRKLYPNQLNYYFNK